jgi:hypothetical protein
LKGYYFYGRQTRNGKKEGASWREREKEEERERDREREREREEC